MKHGPFSRRELCFEALQMLSCLLFLGGAAVLLCLAALMQSEGTIAAASACFAVTSLLSALLLLRLPESRRCCFAVFAVSVLLYAACLLRSGWSRWLLLLPVCVLPLTRLRQGVPLCLAVAAMMPVWSPVSGTMELYLLFFLAGLLVERLSAYNSDRSARQKAALETLSRTDTLTGICNRWWYHEQLKGRNDQPEYRRRYAVFLLDIDDFKNINDTYGHLCGDQVLIRTARIIESACQNDGIVCRWGGDEFLCQVRSASPEQTRTFAEQLRETIAGSAFPIPDGSVLHVTVSIGAVFVPNPQDIRSTELFSIADQALYEAKNNGRNRIGFRITQASDATDTSA